MPEEPAHPDDQPQGSTGQLGATSTASAKENLESSKQHLRDAGDALKANIETSRAHVKQAAEDLRSAAETKAQELRERAGSRAQELRGQAEMAYSEARDRAQSLRQEGEHYVRQNPAKAVLTALAAGFVLGLIIRR
jgi:ElaB/YqjD/DUF883 family membrane-anchored ribosome-binding protein